MIMDYGPSIVFAYENSLTFKCLNNKGFSDRNIQKISEATKKYSSLYAFYK